MEKMTRAKLKDGSICCMPKKAFYIFLAQDKILEFERSDGWVRVDEIPARSRSSAINFKGPERRKK